jgi:hypothetical protein
MEAVHSSETSANSYCTTRRHISEDFTNFGYNGDGGTNFFFIVRLLDFVSVPLSNEKGPLLTIYTHCQFPAFYGVLRNEMIRGWRKLPNIMRMIKSRRMRRAGDVARMG